MSKPSEFDTLAKCSRPPKQIRSSTFPANTTMPTDDGKQYLDRFGKGTKGTGWYSFDHNMAYTSSAW